MIFLDTYPTRGRLIIGVFASCSYFLFYFKFKSNLKLKILPSKSSNLFHFKPELNSKPMN
jgi:hypothetical protein